MDLTRRSFGLVAGVATLAAAVGGKPGAPTALKAAVSGQAVRFTWAAPADTGSSSISHYHLKFTTGGRTTLHTVGGTVLVEALTGLASGDYTGFVTATNGQGESAHSATIAFTVGSTAGAPTDWTSFTTTAPVGPTGGTYSLHAGDDFTGTALDLTRWQGNRNDNGTYASPFNAGLESEYFSSSQVSVANSLLTLTAVPDSSHRPATYRSGCVTAATTSGGFRYTAPGTYSEARVRMPAVAGAWPAFWAVSDSGYTQEIDYLEFLNGTATGPSLTYHYQDGGTGSAGRSSASYRYGASGTDYRSAFHTYGCLVSSGSITAYLDGVAYQTINLPVSPIEIEVTFDLALYTGYTVPSGTKMDVDWVRVWDVA